MDRSRPRSPAASGSPPARRHRWLQARLPLHRSGCADAYQARVRRPRPDPAPGHGSTARRRGRRARIGAEDDVPRRTDPRDPPRPVPGRGTGPPHRCPAPPDHWGPVSAP